MTDRATVERPRGSASIFSMAAMTRGSVPAPGVCERSLPLVGQADEALVPVCPAQPLQVAPRHLRARRLELGKFRQLALVGSVQVRVVISARRPLRVASGPQLDEVSFKPADAFLLGLVEGGEPAVLWYPPGRCSIECFEAGRRQQIPEQHCRQLPMLVLQCHRSAVQLDDCVNILAERDPVPGPQHPRVPIAHASSKGSAQAVRRVVSPSGRPRSPLRRPRHSRWNSTGRTRIGSPACRAASPSGRG